MKKLIVLLIVLALVLTMIGCEPAEATPIDLDRDFDAVSDYVRVEVDKQTGVNYIIYGGKCVCPRYNADGSLYVSEVE